MTEIALRHESLPVAAPRRLVEWAEEATAAYSLAERLVTTPFAPPSFRGKPIDGAAAILAGSEVGLSPMAALNAFDTIGGRPAPKALTLRAVAQSHGHEFRLVKSTDTECVIAARRRGSQDWQEFRWTIDRARRLQLTGKDQWQKQPQAMLLARATAEAARFVAADALLGIPYAAEELIDEAEPSPTRIVRRKAESPPTPEPSLSAVAEPDPTPDDSITAAQQKKLGALMREAGITERADALAYVAGVIGRDITSRSELTKDEASRVIDALSGPAPADDEPPLGGDQ